MNLQSIIGYYLKIISAKTVKEMLINSFVKNPKDIKDLHYANERTTPYIKLVLF